MTGLLLKVAVSINGQGDSGVNSSGNPPVIVFWMTGFQSKVQVVVNKSRDF